MKAAQMKIRRSMLFFFCILTAWALPALKNDANAQTTYFVNDASTLNDQFTSAIGSNANPGTAAAPFLTIQFAINQASNGDIITVDAGTYNEDATTSTGLNTGKLLRFIGATDAGNNPISILVGSLLMNNNDAQSILNMRFKAAGPNAYLVQIRNVNGFTFTNCVFDGSNQFMLLPSKNGINHETGPEGNSDILVQNCRFIDGLYVSINSRWRDVTVRNSVFTNVKSGINHYGDDSLLVENCDIDVIAQAPFADSYCVRFGVGTNDPTSKLKVANCKMNVNRNGWVAATGYYHCSVWIRPSALGPVEINNCSLNAELVNNGPDDVDATCNYWGSSCGPGISQIINTTAATITTAPWTYDGTDTSPLPGFQPSVGSCSSSDLNLTSEVRNVSCFGDQNGSINLFVTGGIPLLSYAWSNGATTQDLSNLGPGTYTVTVTDACGASEILTATVLEPAPVTLSVVTTDIGCATCFGTIIAVASPGASITVNGAPYDPNTQYAAGTYTILASAPNGNNDGFCTKDTTVTIVVLSGTPKYLVVDIETNRAFYYDNNFNFIQSNPMSTTVLFGITNANDVTYDGTYVYVLDGRNKRVYRSDQAGAVAERCRPLRSNTNTALNPLTGLQVIGNSMYVLDKQSKSVYRYNLNTAFSNSNARLLANQKLTLINGASEALAFDGTYFYVLNDGPQAKTLFKYDLNGNSFGRSRPLRTPTGGPLDHVTGAVVDGGTIWITDRNLNKAFSYPMSALFTGSSLLNATSAKNLNSDNDDPTGITLINTTSLLRETPSTEENEVGLDVRAYPNPNQGTFRLQIERLDEKRECMVRVIDMTGRLVSSGIIETGVSFVERTFSMEDAGKGVYLVFVEQGDRRKTIRVVVE